MQTSRFVIKGLMLSAAMLSGPVFAQTVDAEATAPVKNPVTFRSGVEVRHYTTANMKGDERVSTVPQVQIRPILGMSALNDRLSTTLTLGLIKKAETTKVDQRRPNLWSTLSLIKGSVGTVAAVLDLSAPFQGSGTDGGIGLDSAASRAFILTGGTVKIGAYNNAMAKFSSREEKATIVNRSGQAGETFGLAGLPGANEPGMDITGKKKHSGLASTTIFNTSFSPAALSKLTIDLSAWYMNALEPTYVLGESGTVTSSYKNSTTTAERLRLRYAATDKLTLFNDFTVNHTGLYSARADAGRYSNLAWLSYSIM